MKLTRTVADSAHTQEPEIKPHTHITHIPTLRVAKVLLALSVALYLSLVIINNLTDYRTNFRIVQHVMMMDTTFVSRSTQWRAIQNPAIHHLAYVIIIVWEVLACVLCVVGSYRLVQNINASDVAFNASKTLTISGLTCALLLWGVAFISIGGEWFMMWQSVQWNGEESAQRLFCMTGIVLIVLLSRD